MLESGRPIEESPYYQTCPCQTVAIFTSHVLPNLYLPLIDGDRLSSLQFGNVRPKFRENQSLHASFDSYIYNPLMEFNLGDWCHIDDGILAFECCKKFVIRIIIRDLTASVPRVVLYGG